jgi:hypothetical protein
VHTDQDAVLHRITEALTTPSDLQKALVVDEACVDFIVKSILEVISVVSDIKIWMFLNASRESSIQKGRRYGLIKDNSDVKVANYEGVKAMELVAASMLCIGKGHVVIVDGSTLSRIGDMALTKLFLTCASYADSVIFHNMSLGQKAGLVEHFMGRMNKTVIWTLPCLKHFPKERGRPNVLVTDGLDSTNTASVNTLKDEAQSADDTSANVTNKAHESNLLALECQMEKFQQQLKKCRLSIGEIRIDTMNRVTCNPPGVEEKELVKSKDC